MIYMTIHTTFRMSLEGTYIVLLYRVCPKHVSYIASSLDEALSIAHSPEIADIVYQIWVLGGVEIYKVNTA